MQPLTRALHNHSSLQVLSLKYNSFGDTGAGSFACPVHSSFHNALHRFRTCFRRAAHIAELLTKNSVLHTLILNDNFIGPTGALPLFKALERNTCLTSLHLAWNNIGLGGLEKGSLAVAKMLEVNTVRLRVCCFVVCFSFIH